MFVLYNFYNSFAKKIYTGNLGVKPTPESRFQSYALICQG